MKLYFLLLFTLLSFFLFNCTHSPENILVTDYNDNDGGRKRVLADAENIQSNSPSDIFYEEERQDKISYDLILQNGKNNYIKNGLLRASEIECMIPRTKTEFSLFYKGYLIEKESNSYGLFYHYCDSLFPLYAIRDSLNIFYIYLNMYRVIDLQIADETYCLNIFNRIEDAIFFNKRKYDKLYQDFDDTLKKTYNCFNWK